LVLTHRREIAEQVVATLARFEVEHGVIAAGTEMVEASVMVASVQTLVRRLERMTWAPSLIVVDEAHHTTKDTGHGRLLSAARMLEALAVSQARAQWQYDKVGARMAFKSAYDRLMGIARIQGRKPIWQVSAGWDAERRADAVRLAMEGGRLTHDQARRYLPPPATTLEGQAIAGLITGKVVELPDEATRERLAALRASLKHHPDGPSLSQIRKAQIQAKKYEALAVTELSR